jgi:FkbM family methyltransferase
MKVFIDCGAYKGSAVNHFWLNIGDKADWEVHCFEANPNHRRKYKNATVHKKAVWVENGSAKFYLSKYKKTSPGCSLIRIKKTGSLDKRHPIRVKTIDFSEWLKSGFSKSDTIYIKMDIEGAEYSVLEKMIKDKTIRMVNKLFVEYHRKEAVVSKERHKKLVAELESIKGLKVYMDFVRMARAWRNKYGNKPAEFLQ